MTKVKPGSYRALAEVQKAVDQWKAANGQKMAGQLALGGQWALAGAAVDLVKRATASAVTERLDAFDANHDGKLSLDKAPRKTRSEMDELRDAIGANSSLLEAVEEVPVKVDEDQAPADDGESSPPFQGW